MTTILKRRFSAARTWPVAVAGVAAVALAATPAPAGAAVRSASISGTTATLNFDGADDNETVSVSGGLLVHTATGGGLNSASDWDSSTADDQTVAADGTFSVVINGGDGNDSLTVLATNTEIVSATLNGEAGADVLTGAETNDTLNGGAGNDRLVGFRGNDGMSGGDGDDVLVWNNGDGTDVMNGEAGSDVVEVNGSGAAGDQFTVNPIGDRVRFDRVNLGLFSLDIGTTENLVLNGGGGDDTMTGAAGLAALIVTTMNGQDGNDTLIGTDGADVISGGAGDDEIRTKESPPLADDVDCGTGTDFARVDPRDDLSACERVVGGRPRVRLAGKVVRVIGGRAVLPLRCAVATTCEGTVQLRRGNRVLGAARFTATSRKVKIVRVKLNRRGSRLLARAPRAGAKVQVRIDARDSVGNGWRTTVRTKLKP